LDNPQTGTGNMLMRKVKSLALALGAVLAVMLITTKAYALPGLSDFDWSSLNWSGDLVEGVTPVKTEVDAFHSMLLKIILGVAGFVMLLLLYVMIRFNSKTNPEPSTNTHNTMLEVVWTLVPVIILIVIAVPSFRLLYYMDRIEEADMTLKVTAYQWYWGYEYPDHGGISFEAVMKQESELEEGEPRLLTTDNAVVLPVDTNIRVLITAADVLHAWAMPAFGIKTDAVPGRMNETWVRIEKEGTYYGQCSELCGKDHGFMPIMVKAVSKAEFEEWVKSAREEFSANDNYIETPGKFAPVKYAMVRTEK